MEPTLESLPTVEANGAELAYRELGAGDPVVFVHGSLSDVRCWEDQVGAFGETVIGQLTSIGKFKRGGCAFEIH